MSIFLKTLLGKKVKTTPMADAAIEAAKLKLDARMNRMLAHNNQNEPQKTISDVPPLAG